MIRSGGESKSLLPKIIIVVLSSTEAAVKGWQ